MTRRFDRIKRGLARAADLHARAAGGPMSPDQRATDYVRQYAVEAGYTPEQVAQVVAAWLTLDAKDRIDSLSRMAGQYRKRGQAHALVDAKDRQSRKIMNPIVPASTMDPDGDAADRIDALHAELERELGDSVRLVRASDLQDRDFVNEYQGKHLPPGDDDNG